MAVLPIPSSAEQPLGISTYTGFNNDVINLLGAILAELRTTNLILMDGFTLNSSGPPDYILGTTVNENGTFNN